MPELPPEISTRGFPFMLTNLKGGMPLGSELKHIRKEQHQIA